MPHTLTELRAMSTEEVIQAYDQQAGSTGRSLDFYRQELTRRAFEVHGQQMLRLTEATQQMTADIHRWTRRLTWLTTLMAVVAVLQLGTALWYTYGP